MSTVTRESSFIERYDAMMAEALRRHGMIGRESWGMLSPDAKMYAKFGMHFDEYGIYGVPKLTNGVCPECGGAMIVTDVREEDIDMWQGTFAGYKAKTFATGDYVCTEGHTFDVRVQIDGTLGDAVQYINDIAEDWGW